VKDDLKKPIIRGYNFDVASALGRQGRPRGNVYLGVELELDIKGYEYRPDEPRLEHYTYNGCYHSQWQPSSCRECKERGELEFQREYEKYLIDLKYWEKRYKVPSCIEWPVSKMPGFIFMKEDGSIHGVEIVSAPASLRLHRSRWKSFFKGIPKDFQVNSCDGLHVHISRDPLTVDQQWAINQFINCDENKKWMVGIAGRDFINLEYCSVKQKTREEFRKAYDNHHDAVSISEKKTLEIRIFSSTLSYETFMTRLEFVAALVHFVQEAKWKDEDLRPHKLREFIRPYGLTYPNLTTFFAEAKKVRSAY
jgi:hypothetical protein